MAECSLSTGSTWTFFSLAAERTSFPPVTRDSLLARARSFPASMALRAGSSPAMPTTASKTISFSGRAAASQTASFPAFTWISRSAKAVFRLW